MSGGVGSGPLGHAVGAWVAVFMGCSLGQGRSEAGLDQRPARSCSASPVEHTLGQLSRLSAQTLRRSSFPFGHTPLSQAQKTLPGCPFLRIKAKAISMARSPTVSGLVPETSGAGLSGGHVIP